MNKADLENNTLVIIQGTDLVKEFQRFENPKRFFQQNYPTTEITGNILIKSFETDNEVKAYLQGIEDAEGWNKNYVISSNEAQEISDFLEPSRVYLVREHFYQENMEENHRFTIFAGSKSYERAMFFLEETANARDTFLAFLERETKEKGDFSERNLYWEIEEQTLEMWSAESINLIDSIQELGKYAEKYGDLDYKVGEVAYGVTAYSFETS